MSHQTRPPEGGTPPPTQGMLDDGTAAELRPLAEEICTRYRLEFPDEAERYGDAGVAWCLHDNQHILSWAFLTTARGVNILDPQIEWLASVLAARSFPLDRLVRNLEIAADVVSERVTGSDEAARLLRKTSLNVLPGH